jgi:hypothetical protein
VVHFVSQRTIRSSVNIQVQQWEVAFTFGFHRELKTLFFIDTAVKTSNLNNLLFSD